MYDTSRRNQVCLMERYRKTYSTLLLRK